MKRLEHKHFTILAVALVATVGLVVFLGALIGRKIDEVQSLYQQTRKGRLEVGLDFRARLREVERLLVLCEASRAPEDRVVLAEKATALHKWLGLQRDKASSVGMRQVLDQASEAFATYAQDGVEYLNGLESSSASGDEIEEARLVRMNKAPDLMNELDSSFPVSRIGLSVELNNQTRRILQRARRTGLAMRVVLAVLFVILAWIVFRELASPLRAKLVQSQGSIERQEKLSALGILAAGIAHEIRNPLTSIKARLYTQQKGLFEDSPEWEDNEVIRREIGRIEQFVKDFLQFARPSEPTLTEMSVSPTIQEIAKSMAPGLRGKRVRLETEILRDCRIRVDRHQLEQVLVNLVRNGAESMSDGGVVVLKSSTRMERRVNPRGLCAAIEVTDSGPSIPAEVEQRLFDPFFTTKEGGTGLGLSIAARIVEDHGGALEYRSGLKGGATFCILLPVVTAHGNTRQDPPD